MTTIKKKNTVVSPESEAEKTPDIKEETVSVDYDEKAGTSKFSLVNGSIVTLKEPRAKDFIYLSSRMETAPPWQRSGTMAVYLLAHFMISDFSGRTDIPDFDEFMDMLEDEDLSRVGAAFSCFPNVLGRLGKIFNKPTK